MAVGVMCGLLAGALWGLIFLFPRLVPEFSAAEQMIGRYLAFGLMSCLLTWPIWRVLRQRLTRADIHVLLKLSLVGNVLYFFCVALAVRWAGIAPASLIVGILPISITLAGIWWRPDSSAVHEALPLRQLFWPLILAAAGIVCINIDAFHHAALESRTPLQVMFGLLAALAALASWTYFAVANARYLQSEQHFSSHEWNHLTGLTTGAWVLILLPLVSVWSLAQPASLEPRPWGFFIIMCIVVALGASVIGAALWNMASRRLPITLSGQLIVSETVFALCYGFVHAQRWPRILEWAAIVMLIAGVCWAVKKHAVPAGLTHNAVIDGEMR